MDSDPNKMAGLPLPDDAKEYRDRLRAQYQPTSVTENFLVDQMAYAQWRMDRFARLESQLLLEEKPNEEQLKRLRRWSTAARRSFQQSLKTLVALRKSRAGRPARHPAAAPAEPFCKIEAVDFAPTA